MSLKEIQHFTVKSILNLPKKVIGQIIRTLLNTVEDYTSEIAKLKEELQKSKDEVRRLKGEKGKPDIKASKQADPDNENKAEDKGRERRSLFRRKKSKKRDRIKISRTEQAKADRDTLPADAEYKGKRSIVIQDIKIDLDNIKFEIERFYSRSLGKVLEGMIPPEYHGSEFGPGIRSLVLLLHYQARVPQKLLHRILTGMGILISEGEIKEIILSDKNEVFHDEKNEIHQMAVSQSSYQQIDDTGARMDGDNIYTIVTCNEEFCSFRTSLKKDRLSAIQALLGNVPLKYLLNETALKYMDGKISNKKLIRALSGFSSETVYTREDFEIGILKSPETPRMTKTWKKYILEGAAIAFYRSMTPP